MADTKRKLESLLTAERLGMSERKRGGHWDEFLNDHSRIIFSSSFRRLVKKAQVFPLEWNTSIRNRLTHSLEVADVGRTIARSVGLALSESGKCSEEYLPWFVSIVENACLLHDLGNPPFGHLGEAAISRWFREVFQDANFKRRWTISLKHKDLSDFFNFDGNPQGFRIATRLHCEDNDYGLNLTSAVLLSSIKYPHSRLLGKGPFTKKIGFFRTERERYRKLCRVANHKPGRRYFLAYLMELADDCCYCTSDIADAIEKGVVTEQQYRTEISRICQSRNVSVKTLAGDENEPFDFRFDVAIPITRMAIEQGTRHFEQNFDDFLDGTAGEIMANIQIGVHFDCLKEFAKSNIYTAHVVERVELSGFHVVGSLLEQFNKLLMLPTSDFRDLIDKKTSVKGRELEWRLYNRLSNRMVKAYRIATADFGGDEGTEWVARAHLVVDFISGMTDESAKELHQMLSGTDSLIGQTAW